MTALHETGPYVPGQGSWRTAPPEDGWEPISTAPRGPDEWILGIQKNGFGHSGHWMVPVSVRWWREDFWTAEGGMNPRRLHEQPTHWRRLPGPPKEEPSTGRWDLGEGA